MALMHHAVGTARAHKSGVLWATKEEYDKDPSMKLNSLLAICVHHLTKDNAFPVMVYRKSLIENEAPYPSPSDSQLAPAHQPAVAAPDKIVVYACFPSQSMYIQHALKLYKVKSLFYNGTQSMTERVESLEAFRRSDRDGPRVLILSGVGIYGLNIACANILIIVVSPITVIC